MPYVLNVPAGRLSVHPGDPLHFLRFVRQSHPDADAEDFMPRSMYGEYLQEVLDEAERAAPAGVVLKRVFGEVTGIERAAGREAAARAGRRGARRSRRTASCWPWAIRLPRCIRGRAGLLHHPAYFHDPWSVPRSFRAQHSVLIVGSGLTMVDVALALSLEGGQMPLVRTISRHGLLPLGQTIFRPTAVQGRRRDSCSRTRCPSAACSR